MNAELHVSYIDWVLSCRDHWGSNICTAAFLPKVAYLELQAQMKLSCITPCSTDICVSWGCFALQGNTWAASLPCLPAQFLCSSSVPAKHPNSVCTTFMLQLIKHPHYINWQALDHCCYPTYSLLSTEIPSCNEWRAWDSDSKCYVLFKFQYSQLQNLGK